MLLSFRATNHRSIQEEQQLLLVPLEENERAPVAVPQPLPVAGIFGANASGKSNMLAALRFMHRMVRFSMAESEPEAGIEREPFALSAASLAQPSSYVVDLLVEETRYTYGFVIDDVRVVEEWLYSYPRGERTVVFERELDDYRLGPSFSASATQVEEITEANALFLTVAARTRQEAVRPVYDWFARRLRFRFSTGFESSHRLSNRLLSHEFDETGLRDLEGLLHAADTGIAKLEFERRQPTEEEIAEVETRYPDAPESVRQMRLKLLERGKLLFHHRAAEAGATPLELRQQSQGTIAILGLGRVVMSALRAGALLVVDELEAHLHPHLSAKIIELFQDPESNSRGAQLVFSSHDTALLGWIRGRDVLSRAEIWFAEKDKDGATHLFPLSDYVEEGEENHALWYLTGRYGAVPEVADEEFDAAIRSDEERNGPTQAPGT